LSTEDTALPDSVNPDAGASEHADNTAAADQNNDQAGKDGTAESEAKAKPEKTPEQREIDRLRRRVDNLTRQKYEMRAALPAQQQQNHDIQQNDDEPVTLSRAELQRHIEEQAKRLAPSVSEQQAEAERRQGIVNTLSKEWGVEKFDALASELDDAFGGLADRSGKPKPATDAIFYADNPKSVIEYLTDPDNADEADRISKMTAVQAGRAITRLEDKLQSEKAKAKPQPSKAPQPLDAPRGRGVTSKAPGDMSDVEYAEWRKSNRK